MEDIKLTIKTDPKFRIMTSIKTILITFIIATIINILSMLYGIGLFIFIEILLLVGCIATFIQHWLDADITLEFVDETLYITQKRRNKICVIDNFSLEDFMLSQTKYEAKRNSGTLIIKKTSFFYNGLLNYSELQEYIKKHLIK